MTGVDSLGLRAEERPSAAVLARALRDRELRRAAVRLAADAVVLARTMEDASARARKSRGKGRRKAILVVVAGVVAIGLAAAAKTVLRRA